MFDIPSEQVEGVNDECQKPSSSRCCQLAPNSGVPEPCKFRPKEAQISRTKGKKLMRSLLCSFLSGNF